MLKNKLMLPILAVMVGVAASAFTVKPIAHQSNQDAYYWYQRDINGVYTAETGNPKAVSSTGCTLGSTICSKGFANPVSDPSTINDNTPSTTQVLKN